MRTFLLIIVLVLVGKVSSFASHIVGGEFELIHLTGNNYRLNLIIYFDEIAGAPGAKYAPTPIAYIYRKSDNATMRNVILPLFSEEKVEYTIPACADGNIVETTKLIFSTVITLNPDEYADPAGYYITWQRCCRNYDIANIVSEDPDSGGIGAGQTFYLEIPPLIKDGERFINTSPQLFPPLSDYACVNRAYYADFNGIDVDGDSLVYTLVEPLNTPSAEPHPQPPSTAPYPRTIWENSFSLNNIVHGNPDLTISDDGLLRVTPTEAGIFVFAVKCEEYRDGEKIGEVRRDFQMVVVDCPAPGNKPDVEIEMEDGSTYVEGDVLRFLADDSKCVQFTVADQEGGRVNLKLNPIGYDEDNFTITIMGRSPAGDRLDAEVCFLDCPPNRDLAFEVDFIGLDDTCPQPLQDTVRLTVEIIPPANALPVIKHKTSGDAAYSSSGYRSVTVHEQSDGLEIIQLLGEDANNDRMEFSFIPVGFSFEDYGMSVIEKSSQFGEKETWLEWNYDCKQVNFDDKTEFEVLVYLEDEDDCLYEDPVVLTLDLKIILPDNSVPDVYSNKLGAGKDYVKVTSSLGVPISFDVSGIDADGDFAFIQAFPANFKFTDFGVNYTGVTGQGKPTPPQEPTRLSSTFQWDLECSYFNLAEQDSFRVYFMMEDFDKCEITNRDTLTVDFILSPPVNNTPNIDIVSLNEHQVVNDTINVVVGEEIRLRIKGEDPEKDSLFLTLLNPDEDPSYTFSDVKGKGTVQSDLAWTPDCADLSGGSESDRAFTFHLEDRHCVQAKTDEVTVNVHIRDVSKGLDQFEPPNIFTPNGFGGNEYFGMYKLNNEEEEVNILPRDNCSGKFERVVIYNRWGGEMFTSSSRNFKWHGDGAAPGVYFYMIKYTDQVYRGTVTLKY